MLIEYQGGQKVVDIWRECLSPLRFAQGKLREGAGSPDAEILRCAQDDSAVILSAAKDLAGGEELSRSFEPCLRKLRIG